MSDTLSIIRRPSEVSEMFRNFIFLALILLGTSSLLAQQRIDFEGNKDFSTADLLEKFNTCIAKIPAEIDNNAQRKRDYCLQKDVRSFMWSKGYLKANLSTKEPTDGGSLNLVVLVEEGLRYRLGNVKITGSKAFTSELLREKLNLKTGDIADGKEIQDWAFDTVKDLYADMGHVQSEADFDLIFRSDPANPKEGIVDLNVTVLEGCQFVIRRIEFTGNATVKDRVLRDAMIRKEGDIFSGKLFGESIKKLNQLGLFEFIDKDSDVSFFTDNESPDLKIVVRVTERVKIK